MLTTRKLTVHLMTREDPFSLCGGGGSLAMDLRLVDCQKCQARVEAELAAANGWDDDPGPRVIRGVMA